MSNITYDSITAIVNNVITEQITGIKQHMNGLTPKEKGTGNTVYVPLELCEKLLNRVTSSLTGEFTKMHEDSNSDLMSKIKDLEQALELTNRELIETKIVIDKQNQYGRREMIRIYNIPEPTLSAGSYECVEQTVVDVLKETGMDIDVDMIASAQRIPMRNITNSKLKSKPITFKLNRRFVRNNILRQQKSLMRQNTTFKAAHPDVFMTEDLTPLRQCISYKLRIDDNIEKCWSIDGRIKCVKVGQPEAEKPITIDTPHDLSKVGWT
ncbi:unnamed protein product, partial [Meganyctiphanes norvegica]